MPELDVDVFDLLERLGAARVHPASGGSEAAFSCFFHADERPSAYMSVEESSWFCHSCKERGSNAASLVAKVEGVSYATAAGWLREAYGVDFHEPDGGSMASETEGRFAPPAQLPELQRPSPSWQETFVADLYGDIGSRAFEYVRARGFATKTIAEWGLGYDASSDRLTIPVHNTAGDLVGFKGRALNDEQQPKYLILGDRKTPRYDFDPYEASQVVFGLHRGLDVDTATLTEGELDAIALAQIGVMRPISLGMSYMTEKHHRLLVEQTREVIIFFDSDSAGSAGMWGSVKDSTRMPGMVEKLEPHLTVRIVDEHDRDPAKLIEDGEPEKVLELILRAQRSVAMTAISE